jgi:hypothetical protein
MLAIFALILLLTVDSSTCQQRLTVYVGNGYDLYYGNPKTNHIDPGFRNQIFQLKYDEGRRTEGENPFLIPDGMSSRLRPSCAFKSEESEYTGTKKYQSELRNLVKVSSQSNFFVESSFSVSNEYKRVEQSTTNEHSLVIEAGAKCEAYSLDMPQFTSLPLSDDFRHGVLDAIAGRISWQRVIDTFGTHYVTSAIYGGRMHRLRKMSKRAYQEMNLVNNSVETAAKLSFAKIFSTSTGT